MIGVVPLAIAIDIALHFNNYYGLENLYHLHVKWKISNNYAKSMYSQFKSNYTQHQ